MSGLLLGMDGTCAGCFLHLREGQFREPPLHLVLLFVPPCEPRSEHRARLTLRPFETRTGRRQEDPVLPVHMKDLIPSDLVLGSNAHI